MKKIGLLFLTVGDVPHAFLWRWWLNNADGRYAIFMNPRYPDQVVSKPFADSIIECRVDALHGSVYPYNTDVIAHLAMLKQAMQDSEIAKFVLLSESCLPIRPFDTVYESLMADERSWICRYPDTDPYPRRYDMLSAGGRAAIGNRSHFLCSEFWGTLNRQHAQIAIDAEATYMDHFQNVEAAGEHYTPTMLSVAGVDMQAETTGFASTMVDWSPGKPRQWHVIAESDIDRMALSPHLFARKFPPSSNIRQWWPTLMAKGKAVMERVAS